MSTPALNPTLIQPGYKPSQETMRALTWHGKQDVRMSTVKRPTITDRQDVIIRSTGATVCGSDLHLYHGEILKLEPGDILGHEGIGIVEEVGEEVQTLKKGDRVVCSFSIACGQCHYCQQQLYTMCDKTNSSALMEKLYGQRLAGILGYSHLLGGYAGTQCEFFRMPFADVNCFKLPDEIPDEKALFLSDVVCTSYHSVVDIDFQPGQTAAVWGAGPIGQLIVQWLVRVFDASRVILIDNDEPRLDLAQTQFGIDVINFDRDHDVSQEVLQRIPGGVDVCFDAAGFRYTKGLLHKAMHALSLESDSPEVLNEAIRACRKFGKISVIADYVGACHGFQIGALMEKGILLKGNGQAPTQKYTSKILQEYLMTGKFDPTLILTHRFTLEDLPQVYKAFDEKRFDDEKGLGLIKCFIETPSSQPRAEATPALTKVPPHK